MTFEEMQAKETEITERWGATLAEVDQQTLEAKRSYLAAKAHYKKVKENGDQTAKQATDLMFRETESGRITRLLGY